MLVQQLFKELKRQTSDHDVTVFQNSGMLNRFGELGFGFFPMGKGVFAEGQSELSECKVMILGNDFGTDVYLDGCIENGGHESVNNPTIRNLGQLGLDLKTTFFTNFHLGVRKEGTNIKRVEDLKPDFTKLCFQFLKKQLEIMNPDVVICLGHDVRKALYASSTLFKSWGPKSQSLKQLYFNTGHFALDIDDSELGKRKFIVIPHPCDTRNFSAAYVERINETLIEHV